MNQPDFRDYFSRDLFEQLTLDKNGKLYDAHAVPAFTAYLQDMIKANALHPIDHTDGRRINIANSWNRLVQNEANNQAFDIDLAWLAVSRMLVRSPLAYAADPVLSKIANKTQSAVEPDVDAKYEKFVADMNSGTFDPFITRGDYRDEVCGQCFTMRITGWKPELGRYERDSGWVPISPRLDAKPIREAIIELKTGHMLIAPIFDLPGFSAAMKPPFNRHIVDESDEGRLYRNQWCATQGAVNILVGDAELAVFEDKGVMVVAEIDPANPDAPSQYWDLAHIASDYRQVTLIEKERLIDIVAAATGPANAMAIVDDYIKENKVAQFDVAPGSHTLYHCCHGRQFEQLFASDDLDLAGIQQPRFVLSSRKLELKPKTEPAQSLRMKLR